MRLARRLFEHVRIRLPELVKNSGYSFEAKINVCRRHRSVLLLEHGFFCVQEWVNAHAHGARSNSLHVIALPGRDRERRVAIRYDRRQKMR